MSTISATPFLDPFTILVTVPRHAVPDDTAPDDAMGPLLVSRFGWDGFEVLAPELHPAEYEQAARFMGIHKADRTIELVDGARGLLRVSARSEPPTLVDDVTPTADDASTPSASAVATAPAAAARDDVFVRVVRWFPAWRRMTTVGEA